jgi:hypothetical protein
MKQITSEYRAICLACSVGLMVWALPCTAAESPQAPVELVRKAVQSEISSNSGQGPHYMFTDRKQTAHISQTKLIVETRDATAGMVIEQNGRPLSLKEKQAEEARLENYVQNPDELSKKRKQEKEDADRTSRILRALPDAFLYESDGTQAGSESIGRPGAQLVRLKFRPNPNYSPPTRVEQVLTGMSGHLLIDTKENHIAEIDGTLQKDVGFGWGILGHLDRGGKFLVQQADVGDQHWEVTRMELSFTGRILLFKRLTIRSRDVFSGFHPVPGDLTFAQGVELLKKEADQKQSSEETGTGVGRAEQAGKKQQSEELDKSCCSH